ncbi:MAG: VWA domain-containing protein [Bryobacteraceae bacterium]|nr:VWA domain-containing protein [Bryobacteraceae bacterium]
MRRKPVTLALASIGAVAVVVAGLYAQEDVGTIVRTQTTNVLAPTTVVDRDGTYVQGLKSTDFRLYDNDKLQDIKVDETFAPISLVVAVQADYKVDSVLPRIRKLGSMLTSLVAGESGEIAVIGFDHNIKDLTNGFTTDGDKVNEAINKLRAGSMNSALTDAVVTATRMLRNRPRDRRKVLLLIAESVDKGSTMKTRDAVTSLEMANVIVYSLNVSRLYTALTTRPAYPRPDPIPPGGRHVPGGGANTPTENARNMGSQGYGADFAPLLKEVYITGKNIFIKDPVDLYTKYSGGKEYPFISQSDLERAVQKVASELHNQYLITYNPNDKSEGGYHRIRVEVARPGLSVTTRPGYWMATVP